MTRIHRLIRQAKSALRARLAALSGHWQGVPDHAPVPVRAGTARDKRRPAPRIISR